MNQPPSFLENSVQKVPKLKNGSNLKGLERTVENAFLTFLGLSDRHPFWRYPPKNGVLHILCRPSGHFGGFWPKLVGNFCGHFWGSTLWFCSRPFNFGQISTFFRKMTKKTRFDPPFAGPLIWVVFDPKNGVFWPPFFDFFFSQK